MTAPALPSWLALARVQADASTYPPSRSIPFTALVYSLRHDGSSWLEAAFTPGNHNWARMVVEEQSKLYADWEFCLTHHKVGGGELSEVHIYKGGTLS